MCEISQFPLFQVCHCRQCTVIIATVHLMYRDPLDRFLMTDEIDASTKYHPTTFIRTCHHQRQGPNLHAFVWRNNGSGPRYFVRHSDSPVLTFWRLEFSVNEHVVAPTGLQQPNVGLFLIRAGGPSQLLQSRQTLSPCGHTKRSRSKLTAVPHLLLLLSPPLPIRTLRCSRPRLPQFWTTPSRIGHSNTSHCGFSRGVASSKVCIAKHLNIAVQLGP